MSPHRSVGAVLLSCAVMAGATATTAAEEPQQTLSRAAESEEARTSRVVFACPKGARLTVEFVTSDPAKPAVVSLSDGSQASLPARESGSGYRYADDTRELRGKGREVTWTDGAKPPVVCTEETPSSGGIDAK